MIKNTNKPKKTYYTGQQIRATDLSVGELVRIIRQVFTSYGVAEEFTSDRATVLTGHVFKEFCKTWGVRHRVSSPKIIILTPTSRQMWQSGPSRG